jgi:hypothetical protein
MSNDEDDLSLNERRFQFFRTHFLNIEPFSKQDLIDFVDDPNMDTYYSKYYKQLIESSPNDPNLHFVSSRFRRFNTLEKLTRYFSQVTRIKGQYQEEFYKEVLVFDFFLPFNNESDLRAVLDDLFYKDTIKVMIARMDQNEILKAFPKEKEENDDIYYENLYKWISQKFCGYSIGTVSGRFISTELKTFSEVSELLSKGQHYLIDETTAIVKFIFPIGRVVQTDEVKYDYALNEPKQTQIIDEESKKLKLEISRIRFFFKNLFVKAILELVNGEDEIWMIESGFTKSKLYIWRNKS